MSNSKDEDLLNWEKKEITMRPGVPLDPMEPILHVQQFRGIPVLFVYTKDAQVVFFQQTGEFGIVSMGN